MLDNCDRPSVAPNRPLPYAPQRLTALQPKSQLLLSDIHVVATDPELAFPKTAESCCSTAPSTGARRFIILLQI